MRLRAAVLLAALALLAPACGDSSPPLAQTSTDRLELQVAVVPAPLVSGEPASFELHVTNASDQRALLTFDSTQRGDVALTIHEVEVYRWAELRAFATEREHLSLVPGQRVTFALDQPELPVAPGDYELVATVTGLPKLRTTRTPVSVAAPGATEAGSPPAPAAGATAGPPRSVACARDARRVRPPAAGSLVCGTRGVELGAVGERAGDHVATVPHVGQPAPDRS